MKKIKWTPKGSRTSAFANIGSFHVGCYWIFTQTGKPRWYARVGGYGRGDVRIGPTRHSLEKAKQDAKRIVGEILLDYKAGLDKETKSYGF